MIYAKKFKKFKNISHAFFNNQGGYSTGIYKSLNCGYGSNDKKKNVYKNIQVVSKKIGFKISNLIFLNQIHSSKFYFCKKKLNKKLVGDGLITNTPGLALGILTADCAPILFYDNEKKIIGAAHAGWRGAYKKIVIKIVKYLLKKGSNINSLYFVIGPSIAQKNYEVGKKFKKKFINQNIKNAKYFKIIRKRIFFSLRDYIKGQLKDLGIKNIEIIKKDTYNSRNNFFSSRRSKKNNHDYGRNISVIMIK